MGTPEKKTEEEAHCGHGVPSAHPSSGRQDRAASRRGSRPPAAGGAWRILVLEPSSASSPDDRQRSSRGGRNVTRARASRPRARALLDEDAPRTQIHSIE